MAGGRRARHGEPARSGDLEPLCLAHDAAGSTSVRARAATLQHDAALALRRALRGEAEGDRRHSDDGTCLQQRDDQRGRGAGPAGHAVRPAWTLRRPQAAVGRQAAISGGAGALLRRLQRAGSEAHARLAATAARGGKSAADHHERCAARCESLRRQGEAHGRGPARHREGHRGHAQGPGAHQSRHPAGRRGVRAHRLGRELARPGHREALLRGGARALLRRGALSRAEAHCRGRP